MKSRRGCALELSCPRCGFRIYNRRYPKCERCGVALPTPLVFSEQDRQALIEAELERLKSAPGRSNARRARTPSETPAWQTSTSYGPAAPGSSNLPAAADGWGAATPSSEAFTSGGGGVFDGGGASGSFGGDGGGGSGGDSS